MKRSRRNGLLVVACAVTAGLVGVLAPVVVTAPPPVRRPGMPASDLNSLGDVVASCRDTGLDGWALVDHATALVNQRMTRHSVWHLWETPGVAYARQRGFSGQYNLALAHVLRQLGFHVEVVHAARVRFAAGQGPGTPWWRTGHTWLRVTHEGRTEDVSAGQDGNIAGHVGFTPASDVRTVHPWTHLDIRLGLLGFVTAAVWRHLLRGNPLPNWLDQPFHAD